jgi:hypothetical protein
MKPTVEAVLLEFGISFPIRNEITVAKALVKARAERDDLTRERDEAMKERDAWELSSTNWQADCRVAQSQLAAARVVASSEKLPRDAPPEMNHMEASAWACGHEASRAALTAALAQGDA